MQKLELLIPGQREIGPINTFVNRIINNVSEGESKLYQSLISGKDNTLINIMNKMKKKTGQMLLFIHITCVQRCPATLSLFLRLCCFAEMKLKKPNSFFIFEPLKKPPHYSNRPIP